MPSLKQLKQLQDLFGEIGGERGILEAAGIRPDVYEIPANEPPPRPQDSEETSAQIQPTAEPPADNAEADADDDSIFNRLFDGMDDLINSVPSSDELPPPPDTGDALPDVSAAGIDNFNLDLQPPADEPSYLV